MASSDIETETPPLMETPLPKPIASIRSMNVEEITGPAMESELQNPVSDDGDEDDSDEGDAPPQDENTARPVHEDLTARFDMNEFERVEFDVEPGYATGAEPHARDIPRWQWRKYGTKFCRKRMLFRCYYRCMHPGCTAKKSLLHDEKKMGKHSVIRAVGFVNQHYHDPPTSIPKRGRKKKVSVDDIPSTAVLPIAPTVAAPHATAPPPTTGKPSSSAVATAINSRLMQRSSQLSCSFYPVRIEFIDPAAELKRLREENQRLFQLATALSRGQGQGALGIPVPHSGSNHADGGEGWVSPAPGKNSAHPVDQSQPYPEPSAHTRGQDDSSILTQDRAASCPCHSQKKNTLEPSPVAEQAANPEGSHSNVAGGYYYRPIPATPGIVTGYPCVGLPWSQEWWQKGRNCGACGSEVREVATSCEVPTIRPAGIYCSPGSSACPCSMAAKKQRMDYGSQAAQRQHVGCQESSVTLDLTLSLSGSSSKPWPEENGSSSAAATAAATKDNRLLGHNLSCPSASHSCQAGRSQAGPPVNENGRVVDDANGRDVHHPRDLLSICLDRQN